MINITISSAKLNNMYMSLNNLTKNQQISKLEIQNIEHEGNFIKFVFRNDIGRRGAWQPTTKIYVTHLDDEDPGVQ